MPDGLGIPEQQKRVLAQLLRFSQKERRELFDVLKEAKPSLLGRSFVTAWVKKAGASKADADGLFRLLAGLYESMDIAGDPTEKFAADVCDTIQASKDPELPTKDVNWNEFKTYLTQVLSLDDTLGVSAKASQVRSEQNHVFCTARILTDLRPVFGRDVDKGPLAAVVVHQAKITFHENGEETTKDFFVALDSTDIVELKKLLDRATHKEASLTASAREGGINVLELYWQDYSDVALHGPSALSVPQPLAAAAYGQAAAAAGTTRGAAPGRGAARVRSCVRQACRDHR